MRASAKCSLAALLHVRPHEVLGIGLEDVVDLVQQVVRLRGQFVASFLAGGIGGAAALVVVAATLPGGLLLCHLGLLLPLLIRAYPRPRPPQRAITHRRVSAST